MNLINFSIAGIHCLVKILKRIISLFITTIVTVQIWYIRKKYFVLFIYNVESQFYINIKTCYHTPKKLLMFQRKLQTKWNIRLRTCPLTSQHKLRPLIKNYIIIII
jgi:hypothetical protein